MRRIPATALLGSFLLAACGEAPTFPRAAASLSLENAASESMMDMDKEAIAMSEDPGAHMVEYAEELVVRFPAPSVGVEVLARSSAAPVSLSSAALRGSPVPFFVDDDGVQCAGAMPTIQAAVAAASAGAMILVCPGTYHHTVEVAGAAKAGLKIIANGPQGAVILQGPLPASRTEENGFFLRDVTGVTVQGFTVRGFGRLATTSPTASGVGNNILLLRAHGNTISHNVTTGSDMMGIFLVDAGDNLVEHNVTVANDDRGLGCGIMLTGTLTGKALAANNVFRHNVSHGNPLAGIMIRNASTGTVIERNNLNQGGRLGLQVWDTPGVAIERNVMNNNRGLYTFAAAPQFALGLDLRRSGGTALTPATVVGNVARGNGPATGSFDIAWDGIGSVTFSNNGCGSSSPAGLCARGSD
jgi:parallel beta-helix repeat protein